MRVTTTVTTLFAVAVLFAPAARAQTKGAAPTSSAAQTPTKTRYKKELPAKLAKEAKITEPAAAEAALKAVPRGKIAAVELEKEDGKFIYSYDIKTSGKSGIQEVHVDAMTGALLSNVHESPADEKAEKAKDAKEAKEAKAAAKPKKP
ncbi:MAG: PepSY domain-containing protein [bacterium]